jgi:mannose-1-phosphate guanylyltransferase
LQPVFWNHVMNDLLPVILSGGSGTRLWPLSRGASGDVRHRADRAGNRVGYIQATAGEGVRAVAQFVEKPDRATAEAYLASGAYFWNSGMFLFRASRYLQELQRWQPAMLAACRQALDEARRDTDFVRLQAERSPPVRRIPSTTR